MNKADPGGLFSERHPHFTPPWLSERIASHIPTDFDGAIVDPACGAGNLLAAAALRTQAGRRRSADIVFLGTDVSIRAVRECRLVLSTLLPKNNFRIEHADFLLAQKNVSRSKRAAILMNPPFLGYGTLSTSARRRIKRRLLMKGRFNLGYAFVHRALELYRPEILVSLLPSNWVYSRTSWFRSELEAMNGSWEWEDIGANAFRHVDIHLGMLLWKRIRRRKGSQRRAPDYSTLASAGMEVRQGVATGRDALFFAVAKSQVPSGRRMIAVKGRDIAKDSGKMIWVPPRKANDTQIAVIRAHLSRELCKSLSERSCVASRNRRLHEYHDVVPDWFRGAPKILVPEIATRTIRTELDASGTKLPLHSVIAIRVPSIRVGRALLRYFRKPRNQQLLFSGAPRLSGGAVRLQVGALRDLLVRWLRLAR